MDADFSPRLPAYASRTFPLLLRTLFATAALVLAMCFLGGTNAHAAFLADQPDVAAADGLTGPVKMSNECWYFGEHCSSHQVIKVGCSFYSRPGIYARNRTGLFYPTGGREYIGPACGSGALAGAWAGGTYGVVVQRFCVSGACWRSRP